MRTRFAVLLGAVAALAWMSPTWAQQGHGGYWQWTGEVEAGRVAHTVTRLQDGKVLLAGGYDSYDYPLIGTCELYDPPTGRWNPTGSLGTARCDHTATLLPNGKVLVAGGRGESNGLRSCELYDPASGTWAPTGSLQQGRCNHEAVLLPNGKVLVIGGQKGYSGTVPLELESCELYDPASGTWAPTGNLSRRRSYAAAALLRNGKVMAVGGYAEDHQLPWDSYEVYDPASGLWGEQGTLPHPRHGGHTLTVLADGRALVAGDRWGDVVSADCDLYDPNTHQWSSTGSLAEGRSHHAAVLLSNGKVLIAGGGTGDPRRFTAGCELFNPGTGRWDATASLLEPLKALEATVLTGGRVLVVGGLNNPEAGPGVTRACEIYVPASTGPKYVVMDPHGKQAGSGEMVLVRGEGFTQETQVFFGDRPARESVLLDEKRILAVAPR